MTHFITADLVSELIEASDVRNAAFVCDNSRCAAASPRRGRRLRISHAVHSSSRFSRWWIPLSVVCSPMDLWRTRKISGTRNRDRVGRGGVLIRCDGRRNAFTSSICPLWGGSSNSCEPLSNACFRSKNKAECLGHSSRESVFFAPDEFLRELHRRREPQVVRQRAMDVWRNTAPSR